MKNIIILLLALYTLVQPSQINTWKKAMNLATGKAYIDPNVGDDGNYFTINSAQTIIFNISNYSSEEGCGGNGFYLHHRFQRPLNELTLYEITNPARANWQGCYTLQAGTYCISITYLGMGCGTYSIKYNINAQMSVSPSSEYNFGEYNNSTNPIHEFAIKKSGENDDNIKLEVTEVQNTNPSHYKIENFATGSEFSTSKSLRVVFIPGTIPGLHEADITIKAKSKAYNCRTNLESELNAVNPLTLHVKGYTLGAPQVTSISPNEGYNDAEISISDLRGSSFSQNPRVTLQKSTGEDIEGSNVQRISSDKIACKFNLKCMPAGKWNVIVKNANNQNSGATGNNLFTIKENNYSLDITGVAGDGSGCVSVNNGGCSLPYHGAYCIGTNVTVKAVPNTGCTFQWGDGLAGSTANPVTLSMTSDKNIKVQFKKLYKLKVNYLISTVANQPSSGEFNGKIKIDSSNELNLPLEKDIASGTTIKLEAISTPRCTFLNWQGDTSAFGTTNPINLIIDGPKTAVANFRVMPPTSSFATYKLHLEIAGMGLLKVNEQLYHSELAILKGTTVTIEAIPAKNCHFIGWEGDLTGSNAKLTILMNRNISGKAKFSYPLNPAPIR